MSASSGPSIVTNGLIFDYDMSNTNAFGTGKSFRGAPTTNLLTYSDSLNSGAWSPYCGNLSNVTFKTTDVTAPDGSYNATRLIVDGSTSCGAGGAWGLLWGTGGLSSGTTYTCSLWMKADRTTSVTLAINDSSGTGVTVTTTWQRFTYTYTTGATDRGLQFIRTDSTSGIKIYVWGAQLEVGSFATPYVSTSSTSLSRTNTQALLDLENTSTVTAGNLVYNSDNTFNFLYSNPSYVQVPLATAFNKLTGSINVWIYPTSYNGGNGIFVNRTDATANAVDWLWIGPYGGYFYFRIGSGGDCCSNDNSFSGYYSLVPVNTWTNLCCTWSSGGTSCVYINGSLYQSRSISTIPSTSPDTNGRFGLGHAYNDNYFNGKMPIAQIYNKQLTAGEVKQNFIAMRGRYGI